MEALNAILETQSALQESIRKVLVNFKKDGSEKQALEYYKKRLNKLDAFWEEYCTNHNKLKDYLADDHEYFTGKYYQEVRDYYMKTREIIEKTSFKFYPPAVEQSDSDEEKQATAKGSGSDRQLNKGANSSSTGTSSKLDDMMKKQLSNFKAFSRTVSNINLETIKEKWEYEDCLKTLAARWKVVDTQHWEIDSELDGSNQQYEIRYTEHEQKYIDMKRAINSKLWSVAHREKSTPQLDIPVFNGNYQQWVSFKDLFSEAIHNNPSLSNAQKLQFLKSKLKGEAERLIQHLQISSENYLTSWEILNHRYNNKKLIFTTHMNTLMNLPVMQQATSNHIKRIHDVTSECLNAIKNLGINIDTWDPILVHILVQKLDTETHSDYLESLKEPRELPILLDFLNFMENKFTTMESARRKQESIQQKTSIPNKSYNFKYTSHKAIAQSSNRPKINKIKCSICNSDEHRIYYCKQFMELSPAQRRHTISQLNFCCNCLFSHNGKPCTSNKRCRECNGTHNTILHEAYAKGNNMTPPDMTSKSAPSPNHASNTAQRSDQATHVAQQCDEQEILLATALIKIQGADGKYLTMRALIDQGSQVSLITENAAQLLRIKRHKCRGIITGVGTKDNTCNGMMKINCKSQNDQFSFSTDVYIMKSLTKNLPNYSFTKPTWSFLEKIQLADPDFNLSKPIDILLGAEVYSNIIQRGIYKADESAPVAQQTRLGWILCGKVHTLQCNVIINNVDEIRKFWEIEDITEDPSYSNEDSKCVEFYKSTTTRSIDGRYQVRLPLKSNIDQLGQSKNKAIAQFLHLERKLKKNKEIEQEYKLFINEYQELGHMKLASGNTTPPEYYLPHHCVLREESTTTKYRVVFNASETTSRGTSLNDCMCKGPNLQKDLLALILSWRQYRVAFTADIEKMFRQIWVHEIDQGLQKIVWRDNPHELLREYQLTTVTYGTKAAPFLAMMTLQQLAEDEQESYPEAAKVVKNCFYMDDLLHGTHSLESAQQLKDDLISIMKCGGFNLRKWSSNNQELLQDKDKQDKSNFNFKQVESTKTLGLFWNPEQDVFIFQSKMSDKNNKASTKRTLLSEISKLFDPLGWLTPLSTKLKVLFQQVWKTGMEWDDKLPEDINLEWQMIKVDIENINKIQVPRWIGTDVTCQLELHGFSDASQKAYACVIYSKFIKSGQAEINLLVGKSRLVPCNKEISLPRLELSGALLLSKLMNKVIQALSPNMKIRVYGWSDSTAVLGWLQGNPDRWKPFVSHRVQKVTAIMPSDCWRYVKSSENPADCGSRGLTATQLQEYKLWWNGPAWLSTYENNNHANEVYVTNEEAKKDQQVNVVTRDQVTRSCLINDLLNKFSSYTKVIRVLAWVRRFITKKQERKQTTWLNLSEIREAKKMIIKQVQQEVFEQEIQNLKEQKKIANKSKILNLNPFLDEDQVLRVGGRLRNAHINQDMKNPMILPQNHRLTELIINHAHQITLHGGARLTLAFIRQKYWVLSGNRTTKKYLHQCVTCKKQKPSKQQQIMADLPEARVNPSRPFMHTGVDFTGHVYLKANKGRGIKTTKGYVAVFVCMVTKAVHLELVSDLTTSSFIAALRRMSARRGTPSHMYCDNGRNFVGASRILKQEYQDLQLIFNDELMKEVTDMEIKFHFNAPLWPSAGGLWEAAVKSFKFHLKRVIGEQRLTYEEFSTLLTQIEACLNSRPLCAISEDPEDLDYLTPSHFLSSGPVLTLVETEKDQRTRWQLTQKIYEDIWKRWRSEYLSQLTARSKWRQPQENIKMNDVVLVHEDNLPPGKWIMGRVVELHPGKDGHTRVVTLKTKNGYLKRPIIKLSVLTSHDQNLNSTTNEKDTDDNNKTKKTRINKRCCFTTLVTTLLFFMTFLSSTDAIVNVTRFRENQGLYFDKVSNMLLIKDEWKLVVYYQMEPYWQGNKALDSYIQTMDASCQTIREQSHCNAILLQLRHGYTELEYYNQLLLSQHIGERSTRPRARRGLIDGVGYLANSLFGVLDERFAEQYKKDITMLRENENHIVALWKNQTSIVEAENNLLKRTENVMNQQHKVINQHMIILQNEIQQVKNASQVNRAVNDFAIGAIIASNVLNNLRELQNTLIDTVTDIYQGRFNLHLLTPEQLIDELSIVSSKLPKDVSLPIDNIHSDLRKLYNLLKVKTRMMREFLIFEIRIPLISRETYEILQIIPVPKLQQTSIISLIPVSGYIAMNLKKDTFIPMSEIDVRACFTQTDTYFCHSKQPEYRIKDDKNLCIMEKQECQYTVDKCKNRWQESHAINTYIYFCCERCQVKTMCDDQLTAHELTGTGLISVGHGCLIKTDEFTIYPHKPHTSEVQVSPNLYAPTISPINHMINLTIPYLTIANKSHLDLEQETLAIHNKIQDLKENAVLTDNLSYHDVHQYTMIYLIFGVIVVIGIVIVIKRVQRCRKAPESMQTRADAIELKVMAPAGTPRPKMRTQTHSECQVHNVSMTTRTCARNKRLENKSTSPVLHRFNEAFNEDSV